MKNTFVSKLGWLIFPTVVVLVAAAPPSAFSSRGMVASDHQLASQAGAEILGIGGNAVDAMIATVLAAGVVQPAGSGLGGGGFAVLQNQASQPVVLDFREVAPSGATQDMYAKSTREQASRLGGLAVAVPNEANGLIELHQRYGTVPLKKLAAPAIWLAKNGFPVAGQLHKAMLNLEGLQSSFLTAYLGASTVPQRNSIIANPRLAKVIKDWAKTRGQVFRDGWVAQDIVDTVQKDGGILTMDDLQQVQVRERESVSGSYRGWTVHSMPPPSSGGVVLLQVLQVLEGYDLTALGHNSSDLIHLYAETFQHAFADRANFMGDPDRVSVPVERLLSPERTNEVRALYSPESTLPADRYGMTRDIGQDEGTQHISVIDATGLSIALTTTINTSFGSKLVTQKGGIILNNEMDDFVAEPGVPNAYGLIGSEANAVAPGAVPLSSMSPTILLSPDEQTRIVVGASGGPFIISSTVQAIVNVIDFEMEPSQAVAEPRMHHQWAPRNIFIDEGIPIDVQKNLEKKGHDIIQMPFFSSVQMLKCDSQGCLGASDPRKGGWPAGTGWSD